MRTTALAIFVSLTSLVSQAATVGDDFNDNLKNTSKWGADEIIGHGVLTETGGRLQYSCTSGTSDDDFIRQWIWSRMPYDADWEMQMDVINMTTLLNGSQNSFGIKIRSPFTSDKEVFAELYASRFGGGAQINGFHGELETGSDVSTVDTGGLSATTGAVRMAFDSTTKTIALFYDVDTSNGYQWNQFGSFGVAGSDGADGNDDWGMTDTDTFPVFVYGYSQNTTVTNGQLAGDNFSIAGGVGRFDALIAELQARSAALTGSADKADASAKKAVDKVLVALTNPSASLAVDLKNAGVAAKGLAKVFPGEFSAPVITSMSFSNQLGALLQQIFDKFNGDIGAMEQAAQDALDAMPDSPCKEKAQAVLDAASADLAATGGSDFATVFKALAKAVKDTLKGQSAVTAAASCKSSGGGGGGNFLEADIDGTHWSANPPVNSIHFASGIARVVFLGQRNDSSQMSLSVNLGATPTGVHAIGSSFFISANGTYYTVSGQMNITQFSDSTHKVAGTFSFTGHNATNALDTISATSGSVSVSDMSTQ